SAIFEEEGKKLGVFVIAMPVIIDGITYYEGVDLTQEMFFQSLKENKKVTSSQPSPGQLSKKWDEILSLGYDEIIYIPMSSGLSGSYQSASLLADNYQGKVYVVNNHRISVTQRHSVMDALVLLQKGYHAQDIKDILEKEALQSIVYVGVETLEYLKKGGRVTPAGAAMGNILHIKPLLVIEGEKLDAFAKVRGTKKCQQRLIQEMKKVANLYLEKGEKIRISMASSILDESKRKQWQDMVNEAFQDEDIHYDPLTFSISCHVGPDAFGMGISKKII
ncbi:MAG: DegV family protein, partial [Faecalibacillus sp.]